MEQNIIIDIFQDIPLVFMAAILKIGIRTPLGILNGFLAKSNDLKKKCLLHYWLNLLHYQEVLHYWLILLHYREVLYYREFITLLEQNIIIDIFQDIPLLFMAAILKIGIRTLLGILNGFLPRSNDFKQMFTPLLVKFITLSGSITLLVDFITLSGSITLSGVYYIIGAKCYN